MTFFGEANEIGGTKILLEDFGYDVKLFLDFGINFDNYYENFKDEVPTSLEELIRCKLLPAESDTSIKNLYSKFFIFNHDRMNYPQKVKECEGKIDPPTNLDGILISHAHKDHYYGLPLINRNVLIYTGVDTEKIISAHYESTKRQMVTFERDLKWKLFRTGNVIEIKGMKIFPVHVDHSIPAAYGFILNTSSGIIVYSGDFRMHGPLSWMTNDLIIKAKEQCVASSQDRVNLLICEGTHIHKGAVESETIVKDQLEVLFQNAFFDYALVKYDMVDWDRFRTFVDIAKKYNWKYIISEKEAYFYYLLNKKATYATMKNPNLKQDDNIYVLLKDATNFSWQKKIRSVFKKIGKENRLIEWDQLKTLDGKFLFYITNFYSELKKYLPLDSKGVFISSSIDPYVEEFLEKSKSLEKKFYDLDIPSYRIQASGHAKPHDIAKFVRAIEPRTLIPVHTNSANLFTKLFQSQTIHIIIPDDKGEIFLDN